MSSLTIKYVQTKLSTLRVSARVGRKNLKNTDSIKSQISIKTSLEKRTAQKDAIKYSQVTSYFPYRWLYIYNKNNDKKRHTTSKTTKEPKQESRLGTASNKNTGGLQLLCGRPPSPLVLHWFLRYLVVRFAWKIPIS